MNSGGRLRDHVGADRRTLPNDSPTAASSRESLDIAKQTPFSVCSSPELQWDTAGWQPVRGSFHCGPNWKLFRKVAARMLGRLFCPGAGTGPKPTAHWLRVSPDSQQGANSGRCRRPIPGVSRTICLGSGVQGECLNTPPLTPRELNDLRERWGTAERRLAVNRGGRRGGGPTADFHQPCLDVRRRETGEIRKKLVDAPRRQAIRLLLKPPPSKSDGAGRKAWRTGVGLGTLIGLSNPLVFRVGQLPEFTEEANETRPRLCGTTTRHRSAQRHCGT